MAKIKKPKKTVRYSKIDEKFVKIEEYEWEIELDTIQGELDDLQFSLDALPSTKTAPDQESMEAWNMQHASDDERERVTRQIQIKQALITELEDL